MRINIFCISYLQFDPLLLILFTNYIFHLSSHTPSASILTRSMRADAGVAHQALEPRKRRARKPIGVIPQVAARTLPILSKSSGSSGLLKGAEAKCRIAAKQGNLLNAVEPHFSASAPVERPRPDPRAFSIKARKPSSNNTNPLVSPKRTRAQAARLAFSRGYFQGFHSLDDTARLGKNLIIPGGDSSLSSSTLLSMLASFLSCRHI